MDTFERRKLLWALTLGAGATAWHGQRLRGAPFTASPDAVPIFIPVSTDAPPAEGTPTACIPVPDETPRASHSTTGASLSPLYLVRPDDARARAYRGFAWGEFLHHAADAVLARLALVHIVCASVGEIETATGVRIRGQPWAVLVDETRPRARVVPVTDPVLDAHVEDGWSFDATPEEAEQAIDGRLARLSVVIERLLDDDFIKLAIVSESPWIRDDRTLVRDLELLAEMSVRPDLRTAARAPATLLWHGLGRGFAGDPLHARGLGDWPEPGPKPEILEGLAALTRERTVHALRPGGAWWAVTRGCGTTVISLESDRYGFACGMARIPQRSQRFLQFLLREPGD